MVRANKMNFFMASSELKYGSKYKSKKFIFNDFAKINYDGDKQNKEVS